MLTRKPSSLNYISAGSGAPVILIHGIASSLNNWSALLDTLSGAGYRAYAVDLPGHGDSPKPGNPAEYDFDPQLARLEEWIASLNLTQPPVLIGHSLGGLFSLGYAARHPAGVQGLVLLNPFYSRRQLSPVLLRLGRRLNMLTHAARLAPVWLIESLTGLDPARRNIDAQTRRQVAADYKRASPLIFRLPFTVPDLTPELAAVESNTLVVWGQNDYTLNPASFSDLVRALPNARGRPIPGCGHHPHMGRPHILNPFVLEFLNSLGQGQPALEKAAAGL